MPSSLRWGRAFSCKIGAIFGRASLSIDVHTTARCVAPLLQRLALPPTQRLSPRESILTLYSRHVEQWCS